MDFTHPKKKHGKWRQQIVEYKNERGFANRECFNLTSEAKEKLFVELKIKETQAERNKSLILHDSLPYKKLFFNKREQSQIKQLSELLGSRKV